VEVFPPFTVRDHGFHPQEEGTVGVKDPDGEVQHPFEGGNRPGVRQQSCLIVQEGTDELEPHAFSSNEGAEQVGIVLNGALDEADEGFSEWDVRRQRHGGPFERS
jgi:hypothetical protein